MKKSTLLITALLILNPAFLILNCSAQYIKIHDFNVENGANLTGTLIPYYGFLYGMTTDGGKDNLGTIFKIKPDGTGYTKLLDFTGVSNGSNPHGSLVLVVNGLPFLYGMTSTGGKPGSGVIFKIRLDGTGYSKLYEFDAANGSNPLGSLYSFGPFLYGMTSKGGTHSMGVIFKIKPDGTGYAKLLDFSGEADGSSPNASFISDGTFLYGMTELGGANDLGIIFKIKPDGSGYSKLLDFAGAANGSHPSGKLSYNGVSLFGMTNSGGTSGDGVVFKISPDGTSFTGLHNFTGYSTDGNMPIGSLVSDGGFLYGMTRNGGLNKLGLIFKIKSDGSEYSNLLELTGTNGSNPPGSVFITEPSYKE